MAAFGWPLRLQGLRKRHWAPLLRSGRRVAHLVARAPWMDDMSPSARLSSREVWAKADLAGAGPCFIAGDYARFYIVEARHLLLDEPPPSPHGVFDDGDMVAVIPDEELVVVHHHNGVFGSLAFKVIKRDWQVVGFPSHELRRVEDRFSTTSRSVTHASKSSPLTKVMSALSPPTSRPNRAAEHHRSGRHLRHQAVRSERAKGHAGLGRQQRVAGAGWPRGLQEPLRSFVKLGFERPITWRLRDGGPAEGRRRLTMLVLLAEVRVLVKPDASQLLLFRPVPI